MKVGPFDGPYNPDSAEHDGKSPVGTGVTLGESLTVALIDGVYPDWAFSSKDGALADIIGGDRAWAYYPPESDG